MVHWGPTPSIVARGQDKGSQDMKTQSEILGMFEDLQHVLNEQGSFQVAKEVSWLAERWLGYAGPPKS